MSKVLCALSGVEFNCEFLPITLHSREYAHPIFYLPPKKLLGLYQKYRHAELDPTSTYLLFCAYLHSTDLVEFRVPAKVTPQTAQIIANNFDDLVSICEKIQRVRTPSVQFSRIAISPDTCTLENVKYWIAIWEEAFDSFLSGNALERHKRAIADLEERLDYLCKDANRSDIHFAARLADWAEKAGDFPRFQLPALGKILTCAEYWKLIIRKCVSQDKIFEIPSKDLQELITHCEENIDAGSTYAHHLFKLLHEGLNKQSSFLGLGSVTFSILKPDDSVEAANKQVIIQSAGTDEPRRVDYPSTFQYLKAKSAWDMKKAAEAAMKGE